MTREHTLRETKKVRKLVETLGSESGWLTKLSEFLDSDLPYLLDELERLQRYDLMVRDHLKRARAVRAESKKNAEPGMTVYVVEDGILGEEWHLYGIYMDLETARQAATDLMNGYGGKYEEIDMSEDDAVWNEDEDLLGKSETYQWVNEKDHAVIISRDTVEGPKKRGAFRRELRKASKHSKRGRK